MSDSGPLFPPHKSPGARSESELIHPNTMPEGGFRGHRLPMSSSDVRARDISVHSVIVAFDSSFSLFSSGSGSADRCSFASDVHDQDSVVSEISQHLTAHECRQVSSGPSSDPDPDPHNATVYRNSHLSRKEKTKVGIQGNQADLDDENLTMDSARSSFSLVLKECQDRRVKPEILLKKADKRRPSSLDLNNSMTNATNSSPRLGVMKKGSVLSRETSAFPSPGTPNYWQRNICLQKGWSSERVPLHTNTNRRRTMGMPFNNGRALPSKWEDAERWIFTPVSGDGAVRHSNPQPQRRPKSKSGPLGPPGTAYYSLYSPAIPMLEGGATGNFVAGSPFSAGVVAVDGCVVGCRRGGNLLECAEPCMARSVSVHGCSELLNQLSLPGPQDVRLNNIKDTATNVSCAVSTRDMATQMSPKDSPSSPPRRESSFSHSTPSILPIVEFQNVSYSKPEIRDVQVDERVTMSRWSKKQRSRNIGRLSENADDWKRSAVDVRSASRIRREEARITAWENLQKAKAEAAIRKLEMELEKKRSSSIDKILNKFRSAQKKAHEMRSYVSSNQAHQVAKTSHKVIFFRRTSQMSSLSGCFTCHAF